MDLLEVNNNNNDIFGEELEEEKGADKKKMTNVYMQQALMEEQDCTFWYDISCLKWITNLLIDSFVV